MSITSAVPPRRPRRVLRFAKPAMSASAHYSWLFISKQEVAARRSNDLSRALSVVATGARLAWCGDHGLPATLDERQLPGAPGAPRNDRRAPRAARRFAIGVAVHCRTDPFSEVRTPDLTCGATSCEPGRTHPAQAFNPRLWSGGGPGAGRGSAATVQCVCSSRSHWQAGVISRLGQVIKPSARLIWSRRSTGSSPRTTTGGLVRGRLA
jgi:hypothetical protein